MSETSDEEKGQEPVGGEALFQLAEVLSIGRKVQGLGASLGRKEVSLFSHLWIFQIIHPWMATDE